MEDSIVRDSGDITIAMVENGRNRETDRLITGIYENI